MNDDQLEQFENDRWERACGIVVAVLVILGFAVAWHFANRVGG